MTKLLPDRVKIYPEIVDGAISTIVDTRKGRYLIVPTRIYGKPKVYSLPLVISEVMRCDGFGL